MFSCISFCLDLSGIPFVWCARETSRACYCAEPGFIRPMKKKIRKRALKRADKKNIEAEDKKRKGSMSLTHSCRPEFHGPDPPIVRFFSSCFVVHRDAERRRRFHHLKVFPRGVVCWISFFLSAAPLASRKRRSHHIVTGNYFRITLFFFWKLAPFSKCINRPYNDLVALENHKECKNQKKKNQKPVVSLRRLMALFVADCPAVHVALDTSVTPLLSSPFYYTAHTHARRVLSKCFDVTFHMTFSLNGRRLIRVKRRTQSTVVTE